MRIKVKLYSILRQRDGQIVDQLIFELPPNSTVEDILKLLNTPPDLEIILSVDGTMVEKNAELYEGATLALIPAVAGG